MESSVVFQKSWEGGDVRKHHANIQKRAKKKGVGSCYPVSGGVVVQGYWEKGTWGGRESH